MYESQSEFKLLQLTDRCRLKYPSEPLLTSVITLQSQTKSIRKLLYSLMKLIARTLNLQYKYLNITNVGVNLLILMP